ncbi:helix-turn-helix domain-containing protein [Nocardia sp. alder85J]|nr:helix-turn-helix domain-containing protein [Nocardia sp. alder85J]
MYTTSEVAKLLHVDASTVRRWRRAEPVRGPGFIPLSDRVVMYPESDLETFLAARHIQPGP